MSILLLCLLIILVPIAFFVGLALLSLAWEMLPTALGLLICWWLFHAVGCL